MLFLVKRSAWLEALVGAALAITGFILMRSSGLASRLDFSLRAILAGGIGAAALTIWTLGVQGGYAIVLGREYADRLTQSLAVQFKSAGIPQIVLACFAAGGEEVFFRGAVQGRWGIVVGAVAFMLAHLGQKELRIIGFWSVFQGLGLGLLYRASGNLAVPVIAHGLFDMGAMLYFRWLMRGRQGDR